MRNEERLWCWVGLSVNDQLWHVPSNSSPWWWHNSSPWWWHPPLPCLCAWLVLCCLSSYCCHFLLTRSWETSSNHRDFRKTEVSRGRRAMRYPDTRSIPSLPRKAGLLGCMKRNKQWDCPTDCRVSNSDLGCQVRPEELSNTAPSKGLVKNASETMKSNYRVIFIITMHKRVIQCKI